MKHFTFVTLDHRIMNFPKLLLIAAIAFSTMENITTSAGNAKGRIVLTTNTYVSSPAEISVSAFESLRSLTNPENSFPKQPGDSTFGEGSFDENVPEGAEHFIRFARPNPGPDRRKNGVVAPFVAFAITNNNLEDILEQEWGAFKVAFNKTYVTFDEERQRREIFIENRNKVARFNQEYGTGRHSFVQKLNQYSDMLNHEFDQMVNGLNRTRNGDDTLREAKPERRPSAFIPAANIGIPMYVDWRQVGAVTPVKSQGACGACYAFAAIGALEGQHFRKTGRLSDLSSQNVIDCSKSYTNNGCAGGLMEFVYEYVRDNMGIDTETSYPFEGSDGKECRYREEGYATHDTGYILIDEGDEGGLESAVATVGPIAVGIDAHPDSFQFYSNGIYFEPQCSSSIDQINHAVLVVGYGVEPNGQQYWLIKNSYGPEWGIGGYMKLAKFSNNQCGVASYASYPLL